MRILMAFQPVPGHLNPSVGVAQALRDRGHEVAFYSGAEARSYVEQNGFAFYPFEASLNERLMRILFPPEGSATAGNIVDQRHALLRPGKVNAALREWFLDTIPEQIADLERLYDEFQPDLLVSDVTLMGPILILKDRSTVPVALLSVTSSCPIPGPEVAPWGLGMPPARSALRRVQYQVVQRVSRWISAGFRREADLLRLRYELPPLKGAVADEYARVPLFLVVGTPSLDYNRRDLPGCVRYVGLCAAQARGRQTAPDWLESLPAGEPVVHVTEGTVHCNEPVLLRAAVEGLSGLPMRVILSTGKHRRPEEYQRMIAEGKSATRITDAPQPWLINFSRVVGFTAILIGLTLLVMTLSAYIAE